MEIKLHSRQDKNLRVQLREQLPISVWQIDNKLSCNALPRNVKESGKVKLDPHPESDRHQNLTISGRSSQMVGRHPSTCSWVIVRSGGQTHRLTDDTHTRVNTIPACPEERVYITWSMKLSWRSSLHARSWSPSRQHRANVSAPWSSRCRAVWSNRDDAVERRVQLGSTCRR